MQLFCPECGKQIPAENINIQKMVAVCPVCDTVFQFDPPQSQIKRRKVKQPKHLLLHDTDKLHMEFRTNFRLDRSETFLSGASGSIFLTFMTAILTQTSFAGDTPLVVPIVFGLLTLLFYYSTALVVYNKTHIEMDDTVIRVSRKPIPRLFTHTHEINQAGIVAIRCEETPISIKEAYDTPRYRVWSVMADGSHRTIVNDVIEDYGFFIAQQLEERLGLDTSRDVTRLEDNQHTADSMVDGQGAKDAMRASLK